MNNPNTASEAKQAWTREPWVYPPPIHNPGWPTHGKRLARILGADGLIVCSQHGYGAAVYSEHTEANLERVVECVNALAGCNAAAIPDVVQALEAICDNGERWSRTEKVPVALMEAGRSALAALKKGQA